MARASRWMWASGHNGHIQRAAHGYEPTRGCDGGVREELAVGSAGAAMTTYVAFDGDKDIWAYRFLRGWSVNNRIDFELLDAHDLDNMIARKQDEYYVKGKLRERM